MWRRIALAGVGLLVGLLLVEVAVRLYTGQLWAISGPNRSRFGISDPVVGRIPRPGVVIRAPKKSRNITMTIGDHGTRANGGPERAERPLALAVGDSFTFGDEVNDEEAWPAVLQQLSAGRVINAGVPGFGLDQAVLRAEQLAPIYKPDLIVVSFIPHDVTRCELSYWYGRAKPYFDIGPDGLRYHAAHVPPASLFAPLQQVLSGSVAVDLYLSDSFYWEGPEMVVEHERGIEVACLLMQRLAALGRSRQARIVVLAQPQQLDSTPEQLRIKSAVLECAAANRLETLDLFPIIDGVADPRRQGLFDHHMTADGNRLVGEALAQRLGAPASTANTPADAAP